MNIAELLGTDTRPAVVVGSGPSLKEFDFAQLDRSDLNVIAINDQAWMNEEAYLPDYWFFTDRAIVQKYMDVRPREGIKIIGCGDAFKKEESKTTIWLREVYEWVRRDGGHPGTLGSWHHTGASAMCFALSLGATKVALLGLDLHGPHYYDKAHRTITGHTWSGHTRDAKTWCLKLGLTAPVVNCSGHTKDDTNPYMSFEDWLHEH